MAATSTTPSLTGALSSLRTSSSLLDSSIAILSTGTADLPRLSRVLGQTRHFELLPSSTLRTAQLALLDEITPEVTRLLERVETEIERLERREGSLRAKWELQEGRLGRETEDIRTKQAKGTDTTTSQPLVSGREEMKAKQLRSKKDRLSYAVERLQMQAQQTERKLRMSMAVHEKQEDIERGLAIDEDEIEF